MEEKSELLIAVKVGGDRIEVTKRSLTSLLVHTELPVNYMVFLDNVTQEVVDFVSDLDIPFINFDEKNGYLKITEEIITYAIENDYKFLYHADDDYIYSTSWKDILLKCVRGCLETAVVSGLCYSERIRERFTEVDIDGTKYFEVQGVIGGSMMFDINILKKIQWWKFLIDDTWDLRLSNSLASKGYKVFSVKDTVCQHIASGRTPLVMGERFIGE